MYGKVWITIQPHFYPTDSLTLDAKGMEIKEVAIIKAASKQNVKYRYDGDQLFITLDKMYKREENYTVYISYTSKPNEIIVKGSEAITDAKGLSLSSPVGLIKYKPLASEIGKSTRLNSSHRH